jgi:hypothetical protein
MNRLVVLLDVHFQNKSDHQRREDPVVLEPSLSESCSSDQAADLLYGEGESKGDYHRYLSEK